MTKKAIQEPTRIILRGQGYSSHFAVVGGYGDKQVWLSVGIDGGITGMVTCTPANALKLAKVLTNTARREMKPKRRQRT